MKHRIFLLIVLLSFALSSFARTFSYIYSGTDFRFTVIDEAYKTCSVDGWGQFLNKGSELVIPSNPINGGDEFTVTAISWHAFSGTNFEKITIPSTVQEIGPEAFKECVNLSTIEIPESVLSIDTRAFYGCNALTSVEIPLSVTSMGSGVFGGCDKLKSVKIKGSITDLGVETFRGCTALNTIELPSSLVNIGAKAFYGCGRLTVVALPSSVETIGDDAFYNCSGLTVFNNSKSLKSIGAGAFNGCTCLESIELPVSVNYIGESAFYKCSSLKSIELPASLTRVEASTFRGCSELEYIKIPSSVVAFGAYVFYDCNKLVKADFESIESLCKMEYYYGSSNPLYRTKGLYIGGEEIKDLVIPSTVESIAKYAFYGCSGLTSVCIPSSVKSIDDSAFDYCTKIQRVEYMADNPCVASTNIFSSSVYSSAMLYVPGDRESNYRKKQPWSIFKNFRFPVESIILNYDKIEIFEGETFRLSETILPENASDKRVTWTSSDESVAVVDANGTVRGCNAGTAVITVSSGDIKAECSVIVKPVIVPATSITLDRTNVELHPGEGVSLTAVIQPENATDKTLTWSSSNESVATVDAEGRVTAVGVGETTVRVSCGEVMTECVVTVKALIIPVTTITLDRTNVELHPGEGVSLTASVRPENATDKTLTWSSSNESVATVDAAGRVTAVGVGETTVRVSCGEVMAECTITVKALIIPVTSITLDRTNAELHPGEGVSLTTSVQPENATDKTLTWSSSNESVATVDAAGRVTAVGVGETTVRVSCGDVMAECTITVKQLIIPVTTISLDRTNVELHSGEKVALTASVLPENATDKTLTWSSSDESVATVDADGLVTAVSIGEAKVIVSCGDIIAECTIIVKALIIPVTSITLDRANVELHPGEGVLLTANVQPENATDKTLTWSSSNESVATVDATGRVTAVGVGETTIRVSWGDVTAECVITVRQLIIPVESITLGRTNVELHPGENVALTASVLPENATDKTLTWASSNKSVVTVSADGHVTAVGVGEAKVSVYCGDVVAECTITVKALIIPVTSITLDRTNVELHPGEGVLLTANVQPENATDETLTWSSSNESVATVDATGRVTAVGDGETTIRVSCGDVIAECAITVKPLIIPVESITLDRTNVELHPGENVALMASVHPENATDKTLTWSSSDESVATVDANGHVTAVGVGETTVRVSCGDVIAECAITVKPLIIPVTSITLDRTNVELHPGENIALMASVQPENATDKTLTWSSSDESIATVDADGRVTAVSIGETTVRVSCGDVMAECIISVKPVIIPASSIILNRSDFELHYGESISLIATVLPENTTDKTLTWSSSDESVATVDSDGRITGIALGSTYIRALCGGAYAGIWINVIPADQFQYDYEGQTLTYKVIDFNAKTCRLESSSIPEDTETIIIPDVAIDDLGHRYDVVDIEDLTDRITLKSVRLPSLMTVINAYAFKGCTALRTIELPASLIKIRYGAFYGCSSLMSVELPESVTSIESNAFDHCESLTSINLPSSLNKIEYNAFYACRSLKSVTIPEKVTSIKEGVFLLCTGIEQLVLPPSLNSIAQSGFAGCVNLSSIVTHSDIPPVAYEDAFNGCNYGTCILHVPAGSENAYRQAEVWKNFTHIVGDANADPSGLAQIGMNDVTVYSEMSEIVVDSVPTGQIVQIFNFSGNEIFHFISTGDRISYNHAVPGIYIVYVGAKPYKIIVH